MIEVIHVVWLSFIVLYYMHLIFYQSTCQIVAKHLVVTFLCFSSNEKDVFRPSKIFQLIRVKVTDILTSCYQSNQHGTKIICSHKKEGISHSYSNFLSLPFLINFVTFLLLKYLYLFVYFLAFLCAFINWNML